MFNVLHAQRKNMADLQLHFEKFRQGIIGNTSYFDGPYGRKRIIYADWTASGRLYKPIEEKLMNEFGPYVANTHTETSITGSCMTAAYHQARERIKTHVGANKDDVLITCGSGMTGVINKFQRILGLKVHEKYANRINLGKAEKPVVFVTHMEHHSNQTSWLETICDVVLVEPCGLGKVNLENFREQVEKYKNRPIKIAAITSCSNVTGIVTPYYDIASIIHEYGGWCFVDFACSGPYIDINMHPADSSQQLDAIFFSPHKFLGGPGSSGVLVFNSSLYSNKVPDHPGGGTVQYTNPWGLHKYVEDIESREDGGTPPFLQTIKIALAIQLKDDMGTDAIEQREEQILDKIYNTFDHLPNVHLLANQHRHRLGVLSFVIDDLHYNLAVRLLNDHFGIQVRGGCSCAGTYGHYLLSMNFDKSLEIFGHISQGNRTFIPGWVRLSIHPTMTDDEVDYICASLKSLAANHTKWSTDYIRDIKTNEFHHKDYPAPHTAIVQHWFDL